MSKKMMLPLLLLAALLGMTLPALAADKPPIAVAAEGQTAAVQVSKLAARAPFFLFFDATGGLVEAVANPYQRTAGGAGPQVVEFLAARGVKTVIAGEFGAQMTAAMKAKGMIFRTASGNVAEAVKSVITK